MKNLGNQRSWLLRTVQYEVKEPLFDDVEMRVLELSCPRNGGITFENRFLELDLLVVFNVGLGVEKEDSIGCGIEAYQVTLCKKTAQGDSCSVLSSLWD